MRKSFTETYLPEYSVQDIFNKLQDDESREIFRWRYEYYKMRDMEAFYMNLFGVTESGVCKYLKKKTPLKNMFDFLNNGELKSLSVVLYGISTSLSATLELMKKHNIEIKAICDTYKYGGKFKEYSVISVDDAIALYNKTIFIITSMDADYQQEMRKMLLQKGIPDERVFVAYCRYMLSTDSTSSNAKKYMDEYFPCFITPLPNEIYVDAGAFNGETILAFLKFVGENRYKHVYGFEPGVKQFELTQNTIQENNIGNVTLFNKGLWDTAETLNFKNDGDATDKIFESGDISVETVSLDDVINPSEKVTFIKMDIEGAELNALRGAMSIIKRDKPRLAICVYHKPEDIIDIPSYILSLNNEYKLYLRHNSLIWTGTVIYAI